MVAARKTKFPAAPKTDLDLSGVPKNVPHTQARNKNWIRAFKKATGQKKQSVLPTATTQHNEWAISSGWSIIDAQAWRALLERAKFCHDDAEGEDLMALLLGTIEMGIHCGGVHPIAVINFARCEFGVKNWDSNALGFLKESLVGDAPVEELPEDVDDDEETTSGSGKKRARHDHSEHNYSPKESQMASF